MTIGTGIVKDCLLYFLEHSSEWHTARQVSRRLSLSEQCVTAILERLVRENWLDKRHPGETEQYRYMPPNEWLVRFDQDRPAPDNGVYPGNGSRSSGSGMCKERC
jgi:hypothetical protein